MLLPAPPPWLPSPGLCPPDMLVCAASGEARAAHRVLLSRLSTSLELLLAACQEETVLLLPDVSPGALDVALAFAYSGEVGGVAKEVVGQVRDLCTLLGCPADLLIINQEVEEVEMEDNVAVEHELEDAVEEFSVIQDKAEDKEVFKCSSCEKTFIFVKSYERHVGQCGAREGTKVVESSGESSVAVESSREGASTSSSTLTSTSAPESCAGGESRAEEAGSLEPRRAKRARVKTAKGGEFEGGGGGGVQREGGERFQFQHFDQREGLVWCTFPGCSYHSSSPGFKTLGGCKNHQLVQHTTDSQKTFACRFCDKCFASNQLRNKHENLAHVKRFPCTSCDKVFSEKTRLLVHNRIHSGEKPYVCESCGFSCAQKDNLRLHKEFKHPGPGQQGKRFVCPICGASFLTKSNLSRHTISHTDVKQSVCETCGKTFKDPAALRQHTFSHGSEEFGCTECGQTFTSPLYLNRHMVRRHPTDGVLPLTCALCGRGFHLNHQLQQHIEAVHHQVKHCCPHCQLPIGRRSSVHRHIKKGRCRATQLFQVQEVHQHLLGEVHEVGVEVLGDRLPSLVLPLPPLPSMT